MNDDKILIILRGVAGSGKSSFAKLLGFPTFEADQYYYNKYGEYKWNASEIHLAHRYCQNAVIKAMESNEPRIVVSNTCTTEGELNIYLDLAASFGYEVFSLIVENRHGNSSAHGVPNETLLKMGNKLKNSIKLI